MVRLGLDVAVVAGDRISTDFLQLLTARYWHKADIATVLNDVRFRG